MKEQVVQLERKKNSQSYRMEWDVIPEFKRFTKSIKENSLLHARVVMKTYIFAGKRILCINIYKISKIK